jgi:hypothetical protein
VIFQVIARDNTGLLSTTSTSSQVTITPNCVLPAPSSISTSGVTNSAISYSWSSVTGADRYYYTHRTGSYLTPTTSHLYTPDTSVGFSSLSAGTTYYFRVRTWDSVGGLGNHNGRTQATCSNSAPSTPGSASGNPVSSSQIAWTWSSTSCTTGYYYTYSSSGYTTPNTNSHYASTNSATPGGLSADTTYYFRVRSYNSWGGLSSSYAQTSATTSSSSGGGCYPELGMTCGSLPDNRTIGVPDMDDDPVYDEELDTWGYETENGFLHYNEELDEWGYFSDVAEVTITTPKEGEEVDQSTVPDNWEFNEQTGEWGVWGETMDFMVTTLPEGEYTETGQSYIVKEMMADDPYMYTDYYEDDNTEESDDYYYYSDDSDYSEFDEYDLESYGLSGDEHSDYDLQDLEGLSGLFTNNMQGSVSSPKPSLGSGISLIDRSYQLSYPALFREQRGGSEYGHVMQIWEPQLMSIHFTLYLLKIVYAVVIGNGIGIYDRQQVLRPQYNAENEFTKRGGGPLLNDDPINDRYMIIKLNEILDRFRSEGGIIGALFNGELNDETLNANPSTWAYKPESLESIEKNALYQMLTMVFQNVFVRTSDFAKAYMAANPGIFSDWRAAVSSMYAAGWTVSFDLDPFTLGEDGKPVRLPFGREWPLLIDDFAYMDTGKLDFYVAARMFTRMGSFGGHDIASSSNWNAETGWVMGVPMMVQSLIDVMGDKAIYLSGLFASALLGPGGLALYAYPTIPYAIVSNDWSHISAALTFMMNYLTLSVNGEAGLMIIIEVVINFLPLVGGLIGLLQDL